MLDEGFEINDLHLHQDRSIQNTQYFGSDAEILTAHLIDLPVWGANCSKISSILNYEKVTAFIVPYFKAIISSISILPVQPYTGHGELDTLYLLI
ncbi:MAG: hypothetical protein WA323_18270 [Candidatus Nitrosopolaris sp.]